MTDSKPDAATPPIRDAGAFVRGSPENLVSEIGEDVLDLLQRMRALEANQSDTLSRLDVLNGVVVDGARSHGRQLNQMHQALIGEQKSLSVMLVFNAVVGALDQLRDMQSGLDAEQDATTVNQLVAINETLARVLRSLGFEQFDAEIDEPFDPTRMSCVGYDDGESGVVLRAGRSGYTVGDDVVRPASVFIASPIDQP